MQRERIVITESGADLTPDVVTREPAPLLALQALPEFRPVGPDREAWEREQIVEYLPPARRVA